MQPEYTMVSIDKDEGYEGRPCPTANEKLRVYAEGCDDSRPAPLAYHALIVVPRGDNLAEST